MFDQPRWGQHRPELTRVGGRKGSRRPKPPQRPPQESLGPFRRERSDQVRHALLRPAISRAHARSRGNGAPASKAEYRACRPPIEEPAARKIIAFEGPASPQPEPG